MQKHIPSQQIYFLKALEFNNSTISLKVILKTRVIVLWGFLDTPFQDRHGIQVVIVFQ